MARDSTLHHDSVANPYEAVDCSTMKSYWRILLEAKGWVRFNLDKDHIVRVEPNRMPDRLP